MSTLLRAIGTTATYAPKIKRGTGRHSDGTDLLLVPDTNLATSNGDDVTGTAKIYVYKSNAGRTSYSAVISATPATAFASSTKGAVMSMAVGSDGDVWVAYQGTDNSLRLSHWNWNGATYDAPTNQTVIAANAVTNRYRALDIDVAGADNPVIIVYEADNSSGQGMDFRVYVRLNDGTTWRHAYSTAGFNTPNVIKAGSEDCSVSWGSDGIVSNVGRLAISMQTTYSSGDSGDQVRELTFNVSTGTDNSATVVGSWMSAENRNIASGTRRGWLFKNGTTSGPNWAYVEMIGFANPYMKVSKLQHNVFTGFIKSQSWQAGDLRKPNSTTPVFPAGTNYQMYSQITAAYGANRALITYVGISPTDGGPIARSMVMRFATQDGAATLPMPIVSRVIDNAYTYANGLLGIYGGAQGNNTSAAEFPFVALYGTYGNGVSVTPLVSDRYARALTEDTLSAPMIISPTGVVNNNRPAIMVSSQHVNLYSGVYGKPEIELASDAAFTTDLQTIETPDTLYSSFDTQDGITRPVRFFSYTLAASESLFTGLWWVRVRLMDDEGGTTDWSSSGTFSVSHPPVALPTGPADGVTQLYGVGDVTFSWQFSDTELTDSQSAYHIIVTDTTDGSIVLNSGKLTSANLYHTITGIGAGYKDHPLQYTISLWDEDDNQGVFCVPVDFTIADAPTATSVSPADSDVVTTAMPTVTWTFAAGGGRTQEKYRVRVYDEAVSLVDPLADSGWVTSSIASHSFASNILTLTGSYTFTVEVKDSAALYGISDTSTTVTTDWIEPAIADLSVNVSNPFYAVLTWTDANQDADWISWRVYRRYNKAASVDLDVDDTASTWVLLHETNEVDTAYSYYDYTAPLNKSVDYVVVQLVDRFGSLIESEVSVFSTVTLPGDRYYFVPEIPIGSIAAFEPQFVTGDSFVDETEQATLLVAGRGRQVQYGDEYGYTGTFSIQLRNPATCREDREFIERLAKSGGGNVYVRSPFGDVLYVSFGNPSFTRLAGVGLSDMGDLSVTYQVVFSEADITRTV